MRRCALAVLVSFALAGSARANLPSDPPHQRFALGDFRLESGESIHDFSISYVTHGTLNAAKSNAVLMTSSLAGNHHRIDFLIGPGKAFDTARYFVICTDAIGNGLTTSPSTSRTQHGIAFPRYTIRDMVESQYELVTEKFAIKHLAVVTGASMGGMQSLQWGVSHPAMMDRIVALTPLARTPPWSLAVMATARAGFALDPEFANGRYTQQPERAWRLQSDLFDSLATRTPAGLSAEFAMPSDMIAAMKKSEDVRVASRFDANDWISQTYAYDRHNVGDTPGFHGDYKAALASIKAKTLILNAAPDLLNPTAEGVEAAALIPGGIHVTIPSLQGHLAATPFKAADAAFMNATIASFLRGDPLPSDAPSPEPS